MNHPPPLVGAIFVRNFVRNFFPFFRILRPKNQTERPAGKNGIPRRIKKKSAIPYGARILYLVPVVGLEPNRHNYFF